jgi:hypothetical protein
MSSYFLGDPPPDPRLLAFIGKLDLRPIARFVSSIRRDENIEAWRHTRASTDGSAPSKARKRGAGGGSPRKYDDPPTGLLDLDVQSRQ